MHDRVRAVELLRQRVGADKIVEGWVEGPCAQAADLRGINTLMLDFYDDATFVRDLFEFVIELELRFARAQVEAGADLIGVGDAAASLVGPRFYGDFIWPYEKRLIEGLHALGTRVRLHICGNTRHLAAGIGRLGCEIVDLDSLTPLDEARQAMGRRQVLLGNMDPVKTLRNGTPESVRGAVADCHQRAGSRYICRRRLRGTTRYAAAQRARTRRVRAKHHSLVGRAARSLVQPHGTCDGAPALPGRSLDRIPKNCPPARDLMTDRGSRLC
jgi:MtaA/CmuA family methyltransferase